MPGKRVPIEAQLTSSEKHLHLFADWVQAELDIGGPDSHREIVAWICKNRLHKDDFERAWFIGCYLGPYVVAGGQLIFQAFPHPSIVLDNGKAFLESWVAENWKYLEIRTERRPVRSVKKMAEYLYEYARWCYEGFPRWREAMTFEEAWDQVSAVRYSGRYLSMKLHETLRMVFGGPAQTDIRPDGAWSPRVCLALMAPQYTSILKGGSNSRNTLEQVNVIAGGIKNAVAQLRAEDVDWNRFEIFLCNYRQAWSRKQYPGRSHDREYDRLVSLESKLPPGWLHDWIRPARQALFPSWSLIENHGWEGREFLNDVLADHKYVWSDAIYDYGATEELGWPVRYDTVKGDTFRVMRRLA